MLGTLEKISTPSSQHFRMGFDTIFKVARIFWKSFPVRLLVTHAKKNQVILCFWLILFGFLYLGWGKLFGIPYLFLDPEYQGEVNARSLFILGLAFGIFNSSFQITTYILDSERFRFLFGMRNAIYKFTINNSLLPLLFLMAFVWEFWNFQVDRGLEDKWEAFLEAMAFVGGFTWIFLITFLYFRVAQSRPLLKLSAYLDQKLRNLSFYRLSLVKRMRSLRGSGYRIGHFLHSDLSLREVRENIIPVRMAAGNQAFTSNHLSAVLLELATIVMLFVMGIFSGSALFQIPAGASIFLFFAFILMFIGALSFWLRGWSISVFIGFAILVNSLFSAGFLERKYQAVGLDYSKTVPYTQKRIRSFASPELFVKDSLATIEILNKWKSKTGKTKPQMIFICTSGGGIRSATWTMRTLQFADSSLEGGLMDHTTLITGASGGLLGAAYFRELCLQNKIRNQIDYYERKYIDYISRDVLNPVVFSLVSNDLLVRVKKYHDGKYVYNADRGIVFEQTLNQNLDNALNKKLYHYRNPEREAMIPMLLMAPVVVNDGRRLYISPQGISYMVWEKNNRNSVPATHLVRGIEWSRYFDSCDAERLSITSAIRMNATFPYITPNVSLPTVPSTEVMDGGLSDNFGVSDALRFVHTFKPWIESETGGVVLVCIRDTPKERPFRKKSNDSWFSRLLNPLGSVYSNWARNQDTNNDMQEEYLTHSLEVPLETLTFQYLSPSDLIEDPQESKMEDRASLSWHLTTFEKKGVESAILHPKNQEALARLKLLLSLPDTAGRHGAILK